MKILTVIYDKNTKFILDIVEKITHKIYVEKLDISDYKVKKLAVPIMTRFGTKQVPFIVFADENLVEYSAIWNETSPDWEKEINKILNEDE